MVIEKPDKRLFIILLILGDIVALNLGFLIAFSLKFGSQIPVINFKPYAETWPFISLYSILILAVLGLYNTSGKTRKTTLLYKSLLGNIVISFTTMAFMYLTRGFSFPWSISLGAIWIQASLVSMWHFCIEGIFYALLKVKNVTLVAASGQIDRVASKFLATTLSKYKITQIYDEETIKGLEDLGPIFSDIDGLCIDVSVSDKTRNILMKRALSEDKELYLVPSFSDIILQNADYNRIEDLPFLYIKSLALSPGAIAAKRAFDIVASLAGLIICLPFFPLIALMIWVSSPGPIFYVQERVGQGGRPFKLIKFRTMINDAESRTGPVISVEEDPRVTPIGKHLRAMRIDELPQLFNILKGDMSLVGPRPERAVFVEKFLEEIPEYQYRFKVKPGLTGLAQVEGGYSTDVREKLLYDLLYIRNHSFLLDIQIIVNTFGVLLSPEKAKGLTSINKKVLSRIDEIKKGSEEIAATIEKKPQSRS